MTTHRELLEAAEAELIQETFRDLQTIRDSLHVGDFAPEGADEAFDVDMSAEWCDVRLCVDVNDGGDEYSYIVRSGDVSYDLAHSRYCEASSIRPDTDDVALIETARELVDSVIEQAAWSE